MGGTPTTTLTRYRALQAQADEGVRGLLGLVAGWLGFEQAVVFLVDQQGDFGRFVSLTDDLDPGSLRPLGRFALLARTPVVIDELRASTLADEKVVQQAGGPRSLGVVRLEGEGGRLLGSLCLLGAAPRPGRAGDGGLLDQAARQLVGWLQLDASLRELEAAHGGQLERLQLLEGLAQAGRAVALLAAGPHGEVRWVNQGAETLLEQPGEALGGRSLDDLLRDEEDGSGLWERLRGGDVEELAGSLRRPGAPLPVAVTAAVVRDEAGEITGLVLALRDRTHQRRMEQMQRELVASMNHELRTPLSVVSASLQLLGRAVEKDVEGRELVAMALSSAHRLGRLIEDVLTLQTLARLDVPLQTTRCGGERLLGEVIAAGASRATERGVILQALVVSGPDQLLADEGWTRRACEALLDHALERSTAGESLGFEIQGRPGQVRLCVIDQAPPPPSELRGLSAVAVAQGLRLALSVARAVAQRHGGQVGWEPMSPRGCLFYLALPAAP